MGNIQYFMTNKDLAESRKMSSLFQDITDQIKDRTFKYVNSDTNLPNYVKKICVGKKLKLLIYRTLIN